MSHTIGNPLTWFAQRLGESSRHMGTGAKALGPVDRSRITVHDLTTRDVARALRRGADDFMALRTDVIALVVIYPLIGMLLVWFALHRALLPLVFPMAAGFALLGPIAALGLYRMSRRRERGEPVGWTDVLHVARTPSLLPIVTLAAYLAAIYIVWLVVAATLYDVTVGPEAPASVGAFVADVFGTPQGWALMVLGIGIGAVFAAIVLAISVVSFPMLVDRPVGLPTAVATSIKVVRRNPLPIALWGVSVVVLLGIGVVTAFVGLVVTLPVLGHATWHLYRAAVDIAPAPGPVAN